MRLLLPLLTACLLIPIGAQAKTDECLLIIDSGTHQTLHTSGDCETRRGAQSTFKIPLALMGFDAGILEDAHHPVWQYEKGFTLNRPAEKEDTDPAYWHKESIVWFSQKLTRLMGADTFSRYIHQFGYGNQDISGNPGKNDGLTRSWLSSSLQISPAEQVAFLAKMRGRKLGIKTEAYDKAEDIIPVFTAGEWTVHGKTGTGFHRNADGSKNYKLQEGWFVGWAERKGQSVLFARFIKDDKKESSYAGPRTRDKFLSELPILIKAEQ